MVYESQVILKIDSESTDLRWNESGHWYPEMSFEVMMRIFVREHTKAMGSG